MHTLAFPNKGTLFYVRCGIPNYAPEAALLPI